jgi:hypothetical protein
MTYFGNGYGNDTPLWQYDLLEELAFRYSLFEFCTPSSSDPAIETAPSDAADSSDAESAESNSTQ